MILQFCICNHQKKVLNKKVLLRECKRHTARRVVSTHSVVLSWLTLPPGWPPQLTEPPTLAGLTWPPSPAGLTHPPAWTDLTPPAGLTWPPPPGLTSSPPSWTDLTLPPQVWTKWKHYLPHPSDAGSKKEEPQWKATNPKFTTLLKQFRHT